MTMSFMNYKKSSPLIFTTIICLFSFNIGAYVHNYYPSLFWFMSNKSDNYDDLIEDLELSLEDCKEDCKEDSSLYHKFDFKILAERMLEAQNQSIK